MKTKLLLIIMLCHICSVSFGQSTILWSVKDSSSNKTSYLLGTLHQIGNSFVDSIPQIIDALKLSEFAIFETINDGNAVSELMNIRKENNLYKNILKQSDLTYLDKISSDWIVPIAKLTPIELLIKLQQTYIETQCGTIKPSDKWKHFDQYLIHLVEENSIQLYGLETDSLQIEQINSLSKTKMTWEEAEKPIHTILTDIKKQRNINRNCQFAREYMNMHFDYQLQEICKNEELKTRNESWISQLEKILPEKKCFIAVGLLHLYGQCGLIVQLRQRGYLVEPVTLSVRK